MLFLYQAKEKSIKIFSFRILAVRAEGEKIRG
jgi:hypothetical protein